jgi:hypothetical protein
LRERDREREREREKAEEELKGESEGSEGERLRWLKMGGEKKGRDLGQHPELGASPGSTEEDGSSLSSIGSPRKDSTDLMMVDFYHVSRRGAGMAAPQGFAVAIAPRRKRPGLAAPASPLMEDARPLNAAIPGRRRVSPALGCPPPKASCTTSDSNLFPSKARAQG